MAKAVARVWLLRAALVAATALVFAGLVAARCIVQGGREMDLSDAAFHDGDTRSAVLHARRAAVMYVPGASHVRAAFDRLAAIAIGSEARGDYEVARLGWSAVRGAALEARHGLIPERAALRRANDNLARLAAERARQERPDGAPAEAVATARQRAVDHLRRDDAPRPAWVGAMLVGFAIAALGLIAAGRRGVLPDGTIVVTKALPGLVVAMIGIAFWTFAVWRA